MAATEAQLAGESPSDDSDRADRECIALAAAAAQRGDAETTTTVAERIQQRDDDSSARGAKGMSERNGATVDVDDLMAQLQRLLGPERDGSERLVELGAIEVSRLVSGVFERDSGGAAGPFVVRRTGNSPVSSSKRTTPNAYTSVAVVTG